MRAFPTRPGGNKSDMGDSRPFLVVKLFGAPASAEVYAERAASDSSTSGESTSLTCRMQRELRREALRQVEPDPANLAARVEEYAECHCLCRTLTWEPACILLASSVVGQEQCQRRQ